jgi:nucleotide-binding universal stress UspA family protein
MSECILVATDGRPGALGALRNARALAEREGVGVEVVVVCEPAHPYPIGPGESPLPVPPELLPAATEPLQRAVAAQLEEVGGGAAAWPVWMVEGGVADMIARTARERNARFVLLGLREARGLERWLSRETLLRVIHLAHVPVLAVPASGADLPRVALVAVDFSEFSLRAARATLHVLAAGARLHLAHGTWAPDAGAGWATMDWAKTYRTAVEDRLEELASELRREGRVEVTVHYLGEGRTAEEVLGLAERVGADLVAAGSHGSGFVGRLLLGRVSSALAHRAHCAVLFAPPAAADPRGREPTAEPERPASPVPWSPAPRP